MGRGGLRVFQYCVRGMDARGRPPSNGTHGFSGSSVGRSVDGRGPTRLSCVVPSRQTPVPAPSSS